MNDDYSHFGFAYGRVSSAASAGVSRQEQSIEVQDSVFREYLDQIKMPMECVQFFAERGSGAFKKSDVRKRREGAKMWTAIVACRQQHPNADIHFFLTKVDRVGRGWLATQIMFAELRQMRIKMHIIGLGGRSFDCDSLMGQKMVSDLAFYSELEVTTTRDRIQTTIDYKFQRRQLCGQCAFGFTTRETGEVTGKGVKVRELVDEPDEQKWILHMKVCSSRGQPLTPLPRISMRAVWPPRRRALSSASALASPTAYPSLIPGSSGANGPPARSRKFLNPKPSSNGWKAATKLPPPHEYPLQF